MENYIRSLRAFIAANPPDFGDGDADSVLDILYAHYTRKPQNSKAYNRNKSRNWKRNSGISIYRYPVSS